MERMIDYIISGPEGNATILVLSQVERKDYQAVARQLLEECPQAEQVGFVKTDEKGEAAAMDMCGLEFCGNATRAFGFYKSLLADPAARELSLTVSGCDHPLKGWIEPPEKGAKDDEGYACGRVRVEMPVPTEIEPVRIPAGQEFADLLGQDLADLSGQMVHMDGISHLVIRSVSDALIQKEGQEKIGRLFCYIRDYIYERSDRDIPAFGVMFIDEEADRMNPIVYVRDVDTIYFEGSCASGSAASACAQAVLDMAAEEGTDRQGSGGPSESGDRTGSDDTAGRTYSYRFRQPAGTLCIDVKTGGGRILGLELYGGVRQSDVMTSQVELSSQTDING